MQSMQAFSIEQFGADLGGGAVLGFIFGFAAKKIAKIVAVIGGVFVGILKFLEMKGFLHVHWEKFTQVNASGIQQTAQNTFMDLLSTFSLGAGFTIGAVAGFKKG